jgi:cephalosporin-C deacetylase-like acetyl esterase
MMKKMLLAMALAIGPQALYLHAQTVQLATDKQDGIYKAGEEVVFTIQAIENEKPVAGKKIAYTLKTDGQKPVQEAVISTEEPLKLKSPLNKPGWTWVSVALLDDAGKTVPKSQKQLGAMIAPEEIRPGAEEPKDFDAFWAEQRKELDKVPVKATLSDAGIIKQGGQDYQCYDVKVDCVGLTPVSGYLTIPVNAKPETLKAMVSYHGAGVRSAAKIATPNAIRFDINAHGIINGQSAEFYQNLNRDNLVGYPTRNPGDRNKFYFREMFLRIMRSLDYIKTRPEWDGKTLIVYGSSQGGAQALVAAALDPQVTLSVSCVHALSDHGGILAERESGWPRLISLNKDGKAVNPKIAETAGYYDCANFAKRIKAETWMSAGLIDSTCVPTSVYAAYNSLPADTKKGIHVMPAKGHVAENIPGMKRIHEVLNSK